MVVGWEIGEEGERDSLRDGRLGWLVCMRGVVSVEQWRFDAARPHAVLPVASHHWVCREWPKHVCVPRWVYLLGHESMVLRMMLLVQVMVVLLLLAVGDVVLQVRGRVVADTAVQLLLSQHLGGQVLLLLVVVVLLPIGILECRRGMAL